jgi:sulfur relay (sulfurtransferase) complex TusBCD TusD component (DsrE family)
MRNLCGREQSASSSRDAAGGVPPLIPVKVRMLKLVLASKGLVLPCSTCLDARGLLECELIVGARRSTTDELAEATLIADNMLVF